MDQIAAGDDGGWPVIARWHDLAVQYGSNAPWYVTEVGQSLDGSDGGEVPAITEQQQAADITRYLNDTLHTYTFIKYLDFYEVVDDGSGQWGLLDQSNNVVTAERPSFQALASWMSANSSQVNG
jgi:hypothetical protein